MNKLPAKKPAPKRKSANAKAGEAKNSTDWEAIELDYRAGVKTLRQIAVEHSLTHGAINKHAKKEGWVRNLSAKIAAKAQELVSKQLVSKEVSKESKIAERDTIEANATMIANKIGEQRQDVTRARKLVMKLLDELEHQTDFRDLYEQLGELMIKPDAKGVDRLNEIYMKVIGHAGRTDSAKKLADALKNLISVEREVYGIESRHDDSVEQAARGAAEGAFKAALPGIESVKAKLDAVLNDKPNGA